MGAARRRRRQRLRAVLRRAPRQEVAHHQAQGPAQGRRRALPRHRRGPRGRGDRLAPARELKPKVPVHRMVFHEITQAAIQEAVDNPRELDLDLVDAQETRRILDRLYGYEVSPVLWKKVMSGLSAGRVQSVATRLVVDRERERMAFRIASYWDLEGTFDAGAEARRPDVPGPAALRRRRPGRHAARTSTPLGELKARGRDGAAWSTSTGRAPRRWSPRCATPAFDVRVGRVQALPPLAVRPVPHHHAAAGGLPQARLRRLADDAGGAAAVRERLHHLHAHRLDHAVGSRRSTRPGQQVQRAVRRRVPAGRPAHLRRPRSRTPRRRTRRSARPATRSGRRRRPA